MFVAQAPQNTTPLSLQPCSCYVGQGHALRQWVAISGARHAGIHFVIVLIERCLIRPPALVLRGQCRSYIYECPKLTQMSSSKPNSGKQMAWTNQLASFHRLYCTLRRYWCPREEHTRKSTGKLLRLHIPSASLSLFRFPSPSPSPSPCWDLLILLPWILISASYMAAATGASYTREEDGLFLFLLFCSKCFVCSS
ncbi:hypothetical protein V8C34DRAFT_293881 [Trichoderma compactum]